MKTNKIASYITIFNLVVTPLVFFPNQTFFDYYYFPKHLVLMICSLLFVLQIWLSRKNLKEIFVFDLPTKAILVYLLIVFISIFFAVDPKLAITGNSLRLEGFTTMIMYAMMFFEAKASMPFNENIFKSMLITATVIASYGICQYFGLDIFRLEPGRYKYLVYSTIGNQNFFGSYLVLMIPFAVHFWFYRKKAIALFAYSVIFFCLMATMSRGPWLGAIMGLIIYFFLRSVYLNEKLFSKQFFIFIVVTVGVVLLFAIASPASPFYRFYMIITDFTKVIVNDPNVNKTGSNRWFIWTKVVDLIKERPIFGFGISNLELMFKSRFSAGINKIYGYYITIDKAHNEYLDIAVSSGIPSLIAYLIFIYSTTLNRLKKSSFASGLNLPIFCAISGYLVQAFFNISIVSVVYVFWIFLGLMVQNSKSLRG